MNMFEKFAKRFDKITINDLVKYLVSSFLKACLTCGLSELYGTVAEWLKALACKAREGNPIVGSNPIGASKV